ncbi:MAG: oligosaccharide flippase family protein [Thermus sp.]|uniref:oligosaccharide flippase family protein n=1 Tax=Thermus TaxID=270 RepID=UPI001FAB0DEE
MGLRKRVLRSVAVLSLRQGLALALAALSFLWVVPAIGPEAYGVFTLGQLGGQFLFLLLQMGLSIHLLQRPDLEKKHLDVAFAYLILAALVALGLAWPLAWGTLQLARLPHKYFIPLFVLYAVPAAQLLSVIPGSLLERRMSYGPVAFGENLSQVVGFLLAVCLAHTGFGVYAPIAGFVAHQVVLGGFLWAKAGYVPSLTLDQSCLGELLRGGLSQALPGWIAYPRLPLALALAHRFLGPEAGGLVAITVRLVEYGAFLRVVVLRVSLAAFSRLQEERPRLRQALEEGALLQALALGGGLSLLYFLMPVFAPWVLGSDWRAVWELFLVLSLAYLAGAPFLLETATLHALGRGGEVARTSLLQLFLSLGGQLLFLPRLGLLGFAFGEVLALAAFVPLHRRLIVLLGRPSYRLAWGWTATIALTFSYPYLGAGALLPLLLWLVAPMSWPTWSHLRRAWQTAKG